MSPLLGTFVGLIVCLLAAAAVALAPPSALPRAALQELAKANGIKANLASSEIVKQLEALGKPVSSAAASKVAPKAKPAALKAKAAAPKAKAAPKASAPVKVATKQELRATNPQVAKLLEEQGLQVSDLLELRRSIEEAEKKIVVPDPAEALAKSAANAAKSKAIKEGKKASAAAPAAPEVPVEEPVVVAPPAYAGWTPHMAATIPSQR